MAGTLPGVETARRRRFRGSSGWSDSSFIVNSAFGSSRRLAYDTHLNSTSFSHRSMGRQSEEDEMLGGAARKAKERLDGRLRSLWKSENNSQERLRSASLVEELGRKPTTSSMVVEDFQIEVFGLKKSASTRFNWGKTGSNLKSSNQDSCVVCLDKFKVGEKLARLSCTHRFHSMCLLPWLEDHAHCPCCRTPVLGSN